MEKSLTHPILGTITRETDDDYWWTQPLSFAGLGFSGRICAFTHGVPPSDRQLEAMVKALSVTPEMRRKMVKRIAVVYEEETDFYGQGIPELRTPEDVWSKFSELTVFVCDGKFTGDNHEISTTYSFRLEFDPDHEINVECRKGRIFDVICEG